MRTLIKKSWAVLEMFACTCEVMSGVEAIIKEDTYVK